MSGPHTSQSGAQESLEQPLMDDAALLARSDKERLEERYFVAAQLLKQVRDQSLLQGRHHDTLKWANLAQKGMVELLKDPESSESTYWKKQCESHKRRDFFVYYHVTEKNELTIRIDCVIEESLLVPIIAVLNETDLYSTWMPSYKRPIKLGIDHTECLKEQGHGNQIVHAVVNMGWPLATRDIIYHTVAIDAIEEMASIVVQAQAEGLEDDPVIPGAARNVVRMDFEATFMFSKCPTDHPSLVNSKHKYPEGESLIRVNLSNMADAKVKGVPIQLINFVTRTFYGRLWSALLQVAEDIRDGKRPLHEQTISQKKEQYDWIKERLKVMLKNVKKQSS